jgi:hypothetical protein
MLFRESRRNCLGKTKRPHKNLPDLNRVGVGALHTPVQRKVSIGMGNKNMNMNNIVRAALALGVLGALGLASGADWFFGSCLRWLF